LAAADAALARNAATLAGGAAAPAADDDAPI
jgi:hypothetical protein